MNPEKKDWKYWLNEWESYVSAILFIINTVLLITQVISRFVFKHSITWLEELATFLYLCMVYTAIAAAVTHRKQIGIDALPNAMPYRIRKVLLILADVIFIIFDLWIQRGLWGIVKLMGKGGTPLLGISYALCYAIVAVSLLLTAFRCVQDILRLMKENEQELGKKKPTLDLDAYEREYLESVGKDGN
ncbi:MAG: TRAP transporter small permease [Solobacterium sp.]|nr:TRAP transporter small permease [Solobacterium sp.]